MKKNRFFKQKISIWAPLGKWVDPFIGTDYTGHTAPSAACPLGMVEGRRGAAED